jgi:glycosyltransferase involved in cell wall biosynthesis
LDVVLVTDELLGYTRTGGIGTATTFLALGLGRLGHRVQVLYGATPPDAPLDEEWARLYDGVGVSIRLLPRSGEAVEPPHFGRMRDVERALAADPPDVVVTQDLAAPAYTAIRLRSLGLGFPDTRFVVYCHGTRQWITDTARKVRVLPGALAITRLEQLSIELADEVVSPSAYVETWMRGQGWRLPEESRVIPYLTRAVATGEPQKRTDAAAAPVRRIAFFGRLEERKGITPFVAALNRLPRELLHGVEVDFVGRATEAWRPERIAALLSGTPAQLSFATDLDQPQALARLAQPGTLAVMPSFAETYGNTVRECLDYAIPFIASNAGAIPELIAPEDRARVLFEPTPSGIAGALRRILAVDDTFLPARPAFDPADALTAWSELVAARATAPRAATRTTADPFLLVHDADDEPDADLRETLERAQAVSGADVVTCGVRVRGDETETLHFFPGEPGGLGLLGNGYGTVALVRGSLLDDERPPIWQLLARLSVHGARIVSVPRPLATTTNPPVTLESDPRAALAVAQELERALPRSLRSLARLAAGLAAEASRRPAPRRRRLGSLRRVVRRIR